MVGISVPVGFAATTLKEVVELARAKPGQLNWAGLTGALDIMFESWLRSIGFDVKKVPYRNPVEAANDLAAGRVQIYESANAIARPQIQAGKIKMLAVTNTSRAEVIPDIPTVGEAGFPALTIDGLVGLFGPPTMPMTPGDLDAVVAYLRSLPAIRNDVQPPVYKSAMPAHRVPGAEKPRRPGLDRADHTLPVRPR